MSDHDPLHKDHEDNTDLALPGQRLKRTREELRLSRDEVAHHLHLDVQIVDALEANAYDKLPSPAYICGYLRSYARILKLPENDVVTAYSKGQEINATLIPDNIKILPERHLNPGNFKMVFILITVIILIAGLVWAVDTFKLLDVTKQSENTVIPLSTPSESDAPARPAQIQKQIEQFNSENPDAMPIVETEKLGPDVITESNVDDTADSIESPQSVATLGNELDQGIDEVAESVTSGDLKLSFVDDSWTEVTDSNGTRHIYRLVSKDSELFVNGVPPYTILLGNAEGVEVVYKGKEFNHKPYQRDQIAYFRLGISPE